MLAPAFRGGGGLRGNAIAELFIVAVTCAALIAYPLLPIWGRQAIFVGFVWAVIIPVAVGLRRSPRPLRVPLRLLLAAMAIGAVANTVRRLPVTRSSWVQVTIDIAPLVASLLLLVAAAGVVRMRGRNDLGGLIDASLATLALGGLLWNIVVAPRLQAAGQGWGETTSLAVLVMILAATLGALVRLVETDNTSNRSLRLLLAAVALNLAGFVLIGGWAERSAGVAGLMAFLAAYAALALASIDPSMVGLAVAGRPRPDRLEAVRLTFLGVALLTVPVVVGVRVIQGRAIDGAFLIVAAALMVGLVMVRVGLLARQLHRSQAALHHLATHDPLTETLNRRAFTEALDAQLRTPRDCALIFCDLDDFKEVNDSYGHAVGDRFLIEVSRRLRSCVRQQDLVCRLGGDEFVILITAAGKTEVAAVRQRIIRAMQTPFLDAVANVAVTASIGSIVSEAAHRGTMTAEHLIEQADAAMYADKTSTRVRPAPTTD